MEVASGYRIQIRSAVAQPVSRLWQERPTKYSRALLETLALVAYRQPITRGEIEQIRGVTVNPNIIKTLLERGWIRVIGHRDVPGRPELLGTTREFLDYFSLQKLDDLPTLAQLKELEDLRVQFSLPGAEPAVESAERPPAEAGRARPAARRTTMRRQDEDELEAAQAESRGRKDWSPAPPPTRRIDAAAPATRGARGQRGASRTARRAPPSAAASAEPSACRSSCPRPASARGARWSAGFAKDGCGSTARCRRSARKLGRARPHHPRRAAGAAACAAGEPHVLLYHRSPGTALDLQEAASRAAEHLRRRARAAAGSPSSRCRRWTAGSRS